MAQSRKSILIIEDKKRNLIILKETFNKDYNILEARNGKDGLEQINKTKLAAVFLDVAILESDDFSSLKELSQKDVLRSIPVFLITADISDNAISRAYSYGVVDVILEPFNMLIIERRVRNIIELYENRRQMEQLFNAQTELITNQNRELREKQWDIIETLGGALESRDTESGNHVFRIKKITNTFAKELAVIHPEYMLTTEKIDLITHASTLHDVGKIAIPDSILKKPESAGRLTKEEFEIMKTHTTEGCKVINSIPSFRTTKLYPYCYDICRNHHERWDGSGYPDSLKGNEIPIAAQIVSVADVYDALINKRVYKPAFTHKKSCEMIINGESGAFNPDILECFKNTIDDIYETYYENIIEN
jgi:putative two-component system response regulator